MGRIETLADHVFVKRRWVIHLFFWLAVFLFYIIFFGRKNSNYIQTSFFVGLLMPVTIGTTYFLNYRLVPLFLMKGRYGFFLLYSVYTLIGSVLLELTIALVTYIVMADLQSKNMSPASMDLVFMLTSLLMIVFLGVAIKMVLHWRQSKEDYQKLQLDKAELELRFLKTQLHPHFLFNTLNNLYYLALEKSDRAPTAILALSELLDYVLHETKTPYVPVEKELQQVNNYIALESLRYSERLEVRVNTEGSISEKRIAPMLIITLIENSFKHGVAKTKERAWINLCVRGTANQVIIAIENSVSGMQQAVVDGVGLQSARGILKMLYAERAVLHVIPKKSSFLVNVELTDK
jgi:sensor histidine kinase YesM